MSNKRNSSKNRHKKSLRNFKTSKQFYKMRGCSRTKKHLGGTYLAYPTNNVPTIRNPNLAYVGGSDYNKNAYPNPGSNANVYGWLNSQNKNYGGGSNQKGGNCGCGGSLMQSGGNNGLPYGGNLPVMKGIPYPGGTAGDPLISGKIHSWPGVSGYGGSGNYYKLNSYNNGFVTNIKNEGAQRPFNGGGKLKHKKSKRRGGGYNYSNSIAQDFVNVGRQFTNGLGTAYNRFNGYGQPVSPLPWKNQLQGMPNNSALSLLKL